MRSEYGIIPEAAGSNKIRNGNVAAGMNPDIRDSVESRNANKLWNGEVMAGSTSTFGICPAAAQLIKDILLSFPGSRVSRSWICLY